MFLSVMKSHEQGKTHPIGQFNDLPEESLPVVTRPLEVLTLLHVRIKGCSELFLTLNYTLRIRRVS